MQPSHGQSILFWIARVGNPGTCSLPSTLSSKQLLQGPPERCEVEMLNAATSLEKLVQLWDEMGVCPTPAQYEQTMSLGGSFLKSYAWLNAWSLEKGRMSFHVVAKHHSFLHLLWNSKHLNPKLQWCFQGEDYVGEVSRLAHSVSMGVSSTKLSSKVVGKYRILAHLFLTRSMQEMVEGYIED